MAVFLLKNKSEDYELSRADPYEIEIKDVCFVPVMDYHSINLEELRHSLLNLTDYDGIIVTSQRAVDAMKLVLNDCSEAVLEKPIYTVGPTTAQRLQKLQFTRVEGSDSGNGIALAEKMVDSLPPKSRLLFLAGQIHRRQLPDRLENAGHAVSTRIVYRTTPNADVAQFLEQNVKTNDWIVFFSPSHTEQVLLSLHASRDKKINLAAIGPTTKDYLEANGFDVHATAEKPTAESLKCALNAAAQNVN